MSYAVGVLKVQGWKDVLLLAQRRTGRSREGVDDVDVVAGETLVPGQDGQALVPSLGDQKAVERIAVV